MQQTYTKLPEKDKDTSFEEDVSFRSATNSIPFTPWVLHVAFFLVNISLLVVVLRTYQNTALYCSTETSLWG